MASTVNAGARLDRLPISSFHYRIFWLIGAGMFFDGYDLYVGASVLGAAVQSKFAMLAQVPQFISWTFVGMTIGSLVAGFLGDGFGRRFTYQFNLIVFGLASLAAAAAPSMEWLIVCRFFMGLGLGAEIVVGYSTMTEFVPPASRGRWMSFMAFIVVAGFPATSLVSTLVIPGFGWRPMFVIAGVGALIVWYLRKKLPESPRWLESNGGGRGRSADAGDRARGVRRPAAAAAGLAAARAALDARLALQRGVAAAAGGGLRRAGHRQHADLRLRQLAADLLRPAGDRHHQVAGLYDGAGGRLAGRLRRRRLVRRPLRPQAHDHRRLDADHRVRRDLSLHGRAGAAADVGFFLIVGIYVLTAVLYGVYTTELFPTEVRLRANGLCNMLGRGATIVSPFIILALFKNYGVGGVLGLMIGLLVVQIIVVAIWGIETNRRGLEELEAGAPRPA